MPVDPSRRAAWTRGSRPPASMPGVADRRDARQRRQPVSPLAASFAAVAAELAREDRRRRVIITSGPSETRPLPKPSRRGAPRWPAMRLRHRADRRIRSRRIARAGRPRRALHRRRQRPAAHRRHHADADRRAVRADAAGTIDAVARSGASARSPSTPARCPAARAISALRAGRLSVSDRHFAYDGSAAARAAGRAPGGRRPMTTLTLTAGVPPRDRLEQIGLWSLVGIVAAMQLSIAAAQILLTIAALVRGWCRTSRAASGSRRRRSSGRWSSTPR